MTDAFVNSDVLPPAPGEEEHPSLQLANSAFLIPGGRVVELIDSPAAASRWLIEHGLAPHGAKLQDYCASRLISIRTHLRDVFAASAAGVPPNMSAIKELNDALTRTPTAQLLAWDPGTGFIRALVHPTTLLVEHALAAIAADAVALITGDEAPLLAACGADQCSRYLLRTHARRHWCSKRCGDRMRAARSYARKKEQPVLVG